MPRTITRALQAASVFLPMAAVQAQSAFTVEDALSAPYSRSLSAAPVGHRFAWVEDAEGRHNLWVYGGVPGVADEPAHPVTHYTADDAQDIISFAWSPDGMAIAYALGAEAGADGKPANPAHVQRPMPVQVWLVPLQGSSPPLLVGDGRSPQFSRDGKSLLFVRAGQVWSACLRDCPPERSEAPASSPVATQLVFDRGSASQLTLSPDGRLLAFVSRRGAHRFLALFDIAKSSLSFPAPGTDNDSAPAFSRNGKQLAWLRSPYVTPPEFAAQRVSATPWSIQLLDLETRKARMVYQPEANQPGSAWPHTATGEPYLLWTADGRIIFLSERDRWLHLYALKPGNQDAQPKLLTRGNFEVEDASIDRSGKVLLWSANDASHDPLDADRRHVWQLDLANTDDAPKLRTPGAGIETRPVASADGTLLAALASDTRTPMHPALVRPDGSSGPSTTETLEADARPHSYPAARFVTPQSVHFASADNLLQLHGQLFLPAGSNAQQGDAAKPRPALLFFHGGPRRQMLLGYPAMQYYSNAYAMNQYLASRGFIVLFVNYRCGIGYGLEFRECEHSGADGASQYNDALGAVAYLRSRADVDAKRIGIWGGSYGGYFVALGLARNSDLFAAGVDFHGVHEWSMEDSAPEDWLRGTVAEKQAIEAKAHASSPMADISRWRSPVLLVHGDNDPDVAYAQTPMLADALRARNVHVEELVLPDETHEFQLHRSWIEAYQATAAFLEKTLQPAGFNAPSAAKPLK